MNRKAPPLANRRPEAVPLLITAALSKAALLKKHEIESVSLLVNVKVEQATIRAGYSEKISGSQGSENLQKLDVLYT